MPSVSTIVNSLIVIVSLGILFLVLLNWGKIFRRKAKVVKMEMEDGFDDTENFY